MGVRRPRFAPSSDRPPANILAIDIGGSKVKCLASGQTEPRKAASGKRMTPAVMIQQVTELAADWQYDAVSIGYPGLVGPNGPQSEPGNLGDGWVGFDFAAGFGKPVRIINDAAMQALGSYEGGRMLFLGLGTGLGSTLISDHIILPMELGGLPFRGEPLWYFLGRKGLKRLGKLEWRKVIKEVVEAFTNAFTVDYVVLGGGNAKVVKDLPAGARLGHNLTAFRGGFRLWSLEDVPTLNGNGADAAQAAPARRVEWRVI